MLEVKQGDIFESSAQTLVNTVNCTGVMGKGVALGFKKRFPEMYSDYLWRCSLGEVQLGRPYLYKQTHGPWILNFPTKAHWRSVSSLKDLVEGLKYLADHYREWGIKSLAVPPLGCGQGGLDWAIVGPTLYNYLSRLDVPVELYAPHNAPDEQLDGQFLAGRCKQVDGVRKRIADGWILVVEALRRIRQNPHHRPIGRVIFEKMAYFGHALDFKLGTGFERGAYGPHSRDYKTILTQLVNNGLVTEAKSGPMLVVDVGPAFEHVQDERKQFIARHDAEIDDLADLILRVDTHLAELLATVHYAVSELADGSDSGTSEIDVYRYVQTWKKGRLGSGAIALAIRTLAALGWIEVQSSPSLPVSEVI